MRERLCFVYGKRVLSNILPSASRERQSLAAARPAIKTLSLRSRLVDGRKNRSTFSTIPFERRTSTQSLKISSPLILELYKRRFTRKKKNGGNAERSSVAREKDKLVKNMADHALSRSTRNFRPAAREGFGVALRKRERASYMCNFECAGPPREMVAEAPARVTSLD